MCVELPRHDACGWDRQVSEGSFYCEFVGCVWLLQGALDLFVVDIDEDNRCDAGCLYFQGLDVLVNDNVWSGLALEVRVGGGNVGDCSRTVG